MGSEVKKHYDKLSYLGGPRTPIRVAILKELYANGPLRKSELEKLFVKGKASKGKEEKTEWGFEVSKPTLYRQFDNSPEENTGESQSLVERGWVKDVSESRGAEAEYAITPKGRLIHEVMRSLFETFGLVEDVQPELEPFLEVATKFDVEIDRDVLRELTDAEVYAATPTDLNIPSSEYLDFISDADHVRGISWVSSDLFVEQYHGYVKEQEKTVELILTSEVLENLAKEHTEDWGEILETGNVTLFEHDVYPFGMTVVKRGVAWGYFDTERGTHEYELITESDVVHDWATRVFERFREEGRNITDEQIRKTRSALEG